MRRAGRPKVTWKTVQTDPNYRAIWTLLQSGPKTFKQIRNELGQQSADPSRPPASRVLPGTLLKRLRKLDRAGLVRFERRPGVLKRWIANDLLKPEKPIGVGRPAVGAWLADPSDRAAIQVALTHADLLSETPKEHLTLERIGNGTDVLVSGTTGDVARWWTPQTFDGRLGQLFEIADRAAREIGRTILASNPDAVRAQRRLRTVVRRYRGLADRAKKPVRTVPQIEEALTEAGKFEFLLSIRVLPAHWWEDSGVPIELVSKADVTLTRIYELTRPASMPINAVSPELAKEFEGMHGSPPKGVTILAATQTPRKHARGAKQRPDDAS
jgi:hypothetical protein